MVQVAGLLSGWWQVAGALGKHVVHHPSAKAGGGHCGGAQGERQVPPSADPFNVNPVSARSPKPAVPCINDREGRARTIVIKREWPRLPSLPSPPQPLGQLLRSYPLRGQLVASCPPEAMLCLRTATCPRKQMTVPAPSAAQAAALVAAAALSATPAQPKDDS